MRKFLLSLAAAAALGLGALATAPAPAEAQSVTIRVGEPYGRSPDRPYWHHRYYGHRYHRPVYYRPAPVYHPYPRYARPVVYGPRCTIRTTRYWDGFSWVTRRREICR